MAALDRSGSEVPLEIPNTYRPEAGRLDLGRAARAAIGTRRVRGLVLEGGRLRRWIASRDELPFGPSRTPLVFVFGAADAGRARVVRVHGAGFVPASRGGLPVRILVGPEVVARDVQLDAKGSFSADVPMRQLPGDDADTLLVSIEPEAAGQSIGLQFRIAFNGVEILSPDPILINGTIGDG